MTTFKGRYDHTAHFHIEPMRDGDGIYIALRENDNWATTILDPADDAAIALTVLKATGREVANLERLDAISLAMTQLQAALDDKDKAAERDRRRDELAHEFFAGVYPEPKGCYHMSSTPIRAAIEHIIALEIALEEAAK